MRKPKQQDKPLNDLSRCLTPLDVNHTLIAVIELSQESRWNYPWRGASALKKVAADENQL